MFQKWDTIGHCLLFRCRYMVRIKRFTSTLFLCQVGGCSIGSVVAMYVILTVSSFPVLRFVNLTFSFHLIHSFCFLQLQYLPVYALTLGLLAQIFIACLLGHFIEVSVRFEIKSICFCLNLIHTLLFSFVYSMTRFIERHWI